MNSRLLRYCRIALIIVIAALCTGCVKETRNGDSVKYTYELWVPLSIVGAGIGGILLGCVLWSFQNTYKWTPLVLGVLGVLIGPAMFLDYATVDPQGLEIRTGIPYIATMERVQFDDVEQVRQTKRVTRGRRGRRTTNYYYEFDLKSGETVAVNISGNNLRQSARQRIDDQLHARNIQVVDDFEP